MDLLKKTNKRYVILLFCFFSYAVAYGQESGIKYEQTGFVEQIVEMIAEQMEDEEIDYTTLFDDLIYYIKNPLNLNLASAEDFEQLLFLTDLQIANIITHRAKNGKFISIYELQSIKGFDLFTISKLTPFIKVSRDLDTPNLSFSNLLKNGKNQFFIRYHQVIEEQEGFAPIESEELAEKPNSRYLGSKPKIYSRYNYKYGNKISFGITAEKDAGEEFFKGSQPNGFDYYTGHFFMKDFGPLKRLAIGDYQLQFGQGLTCWTGLAFGKTSATMNVKRNPQLIRPYSSVGENAFMRGVAATVGVGKFELTAFYSKNSIDGNISNSDTISREVLEITSLQQSGFHSTPAELEDKDAIQEMVFGGNATFKTSKGRFGLTATSTKFSAELNRNLSIYNQFEFTGSTNSNIGADYSYLLQNFNFFGEFSLSSNGGYAFMNGMLVSLDPKLSLSAIYREYRKEYQSLYGIAFGENTKNANEKGLYLGIESKINRSWTFVGYFDTFSFPWLKYRTDAPSIGNEWLAQLYFKPSKKLQMYVRYRKEHKMENGSSDIQGIDPLGNRTRSYFRLHTSIKVSPVLTLKNRLELSSYEFSDQAPEKGGLIYQDIVYKHETVPITVTARFSMFDTDSYNSRIYAYESDLLYSYSIPGHYYSGTRAYVMLRYTIIRGVDLWLRYSQTYYDDRSEIGSGLKTIKGNTKSEIKTQLRIKF